jgi:hypothetical protein
LNGEPERAADGVDAEGVERVFLILALGSTPSGCLFAQFFTRNAATLVTPMQPAPFKSKKPKRPDARLGALWVGHATVLVQLDDKFVLTDPVFTDSVGQISKRMVEPGIEIADLPPVDAALISHMHFDHLSLGTLDSIEHKLALIYLPEGGAVYVPGSPVPTIELPTWQSHEAGGVRVTAVPVRHNGWRYAGDRSWMTKSYTGYVIEYRDLVVYFGGDTGYTTAFRETARRFPHTKDPADRTDSSTLVHVPAPHRSQGGSRRLSRSGRPFDASDALRHLRQLRSVG